MRRPLGVSARFCKVRFLRIAAVGTGRSEGPQSVHCDVVSRTPTVSL